MEGFSSYSIVFVPYFWYNLAIMEHLIEKYNKGKTIAVISSYPEKNSTYSKKVCAVGGFTKNTLVSFKNKKVVFTVKISKKEEVYEENNILVLRVLDRDNPLSILSLIKYIFKFNQIKNFLIEFEFGSFGNIEAVSAFLIAPFILKILGKKQVIVVHQVINNLGTISGHLGWIDDDLRIDIFNPLLHLFYKMIYALSNNTVVTEPYLKKNLKKIVGDGQKIKVIPHGVDTKIKLLDQKKSRTILKLPKNKFILLYFGYLSWYKGADLFQEYAKKSLRNKKLLFIMAGGKSFTNKNKRHYKEYLDNFIEKPKNLIITGFVPENKINLYYSSADLIMAPYRVMMSSSGPLSLAFSYEKPTILSRPLEDYFQSYDFKNALKILKLEKEDFIFDLNQESFKKRLVWAKKNLNKLSDFSKLMKKKRAYGKISKQYLNLFK